MSLNHVLSTNLSDGLASEVLRLQVAMRGVRLFGARGLCEIRTTFLCLSCLGSLSFSAAISLLPPFLSGPLRVLLARCLDCIWVIWIFLPLDVSFRMVSLALVYLSFFLYDGFCMSRSFVRAFFLL